MKVQNMAIIFIIVIIPILMLLGYYLPVVNTIKDLVKFNNIFSNILILGFFGLGVLIGIVLISKLIEFLLKRYEAKAYFGVLGFIFASILAIPVSVYHEIGNITFTVPQALIGLILFSFIWMGIICIKEKVKIEDSY